MDLDELDFDAFEAIYQRGSVRPMLQSAFASAVSMTFGAPPGEVCVELWVVYCELLGTVPEVELQAALARGAPAYWNQTLAYGGRANLLNPPPLNKEPHGLLPQHQQPAPDPLPDLLELI